MPKMQPAFSFSVYACLMLGFVITVPTYGQTWMKMVMCVSDVGEKYINVCAREKNVSTEIAVDLASCSADFLGVAFPILSECFIKQGVPGRLNDPCFSYFNILDAHRRNRTRRSANPSYVDMFGVEMAEFMQCIEDKYASFEADLRVCDSSCKPPMTQQIDALFVCTSKNDSAAVEAIAATKQGYECARAIFGNATRVLMKNR